MSWMLERGVWPHRVVGVLHRVVGVLHRVLSVQHRVAGVLHRVLGVLGEVEVEVDLVNLIIFSTHVVRGYMGFGAWSSGRGHQGSRARSSVRPVTEPAQVVGEQATRLHRHGGGDYRGCPGFTVVAIRLYYVCFHLTSNVYT